MGPSPPFLPRWRANPVCVTVAPSGVPDWGNFGVMPVRKLPDSALVSYSWYHSRYSHASESSAPGYYTVDLQDWNATAELTASGTHSGMHRYTCHGEGPCVILLDMCHAVQEDFDHTCKNASVSVSVGPNGTAVVTGWVQQAGQFSCPSVRPPAPLHCVRVNPCDPACARACVTAAGAPLGGIFIYLYAIVSSVTPLASAGVWSDGVVMPSGTFVPPSSSGSVGAYFAYDGGDQVCVSLCTVARAPLTPSWLCVCVCAGG